MNQDEVPRDRRAPPSSSASATGAAAMRAVWSSVVMGKWSAEYAGVALGVGLLALGLSVSVPGTAPAAAPSFSAHAADSLAKGDCTRAGCHAAAKKPAHEHAPFAERACDACHVVKPGVAPAWVAGSADKACAECHSVAADAADAHTQHPPVAEGCVSCHRPHGSDTPALLNEPQPALCTNCHEAKALAVHVIAGLRADQGHPLAAEKDPSRKDRRFECTSCHEPHASAGPRLFRFKARDAFDLCQHCHKF